MFDFELKNDYFGNKTNGFCVERIKKKNECICLNHRNFI